MKSQQKSVEFLVSDAPIPYIEATQVMESRVLAVGDETASQLIWFLEHEPVFTAGSATCSDSITDEAVNLVRTNRGGKCTWHGPGQRVVYLVLNLKKFFAPDAPDIRKFVRFLESSVSSALEAVGIKTVTFSDMPGIYVQKAEGIFKIASLGLKVGRWVTSHGIAININPDLRQFSLINPCGLSGVGVTSVAQELGRDVNVDAIDYALRDFFEKGLLIENADPRFESR